jgi:hypothetical protein
MLAWRKSLWAGVLAVVTGVLQAPDIPIAATQAMAWKSFDDRKILG